MTDNIEELQPSLDDTKEPSHFYTLEGHWQPWYDDRRDYNTNASTYYDYLANNNQVFKTAVELVNKISNRDVKVKDTSSVSMLAEGDWKKLEDDKTISATVNVNGDSDNLLQHTDTGLKVPVTHDHQKSQKIGETNTIAPENEGLNGTEDLTTLKLKVSKDLENGVIVREDGVFVQNTNKNYENLNGRLQNLENSLPAGSDEVTQARVAYDGTSFGSLIQALQYQFDNSIKSFRNVTSGPKDEPYNNINNLPKNSVVTYSNIENVENLPTASTGAVVLTFTGSKTNSRTGSVQICYTPEREAYFRILWFYEGELKWSKWKKITNEDTYMVGDRQIYDANTMKAPYDDLNTVPLNTIITYSYYPKELKNKPIKDYTKGASINTYNYTDSTYLGAVQTLTQIDGRCFSRIYWNFDGVKRWSSWKEVGNEYVDEYPLGIELFENIAVIGDSYSSGELYPNSSGIDYYNISWIQLMARKHGLKATNYSRGGLQTRTWLTSPYGLKKMQADTPKDLYFIYLGINDNRQLKDEEIGSESDIYLGTDTFYGNYGKIIKAVTEKSPHAKIAIINVQNPDYNRLYPHINKIAAFFKLPVLDLSKDVYTARSDYSSDMKEGHPQALGYAKLGGAIERLLNKSFVDNKKYWINYVPQTNE